MNSVKKNALVVKLLVAALTFLAVCLLAVTSKHFSPNRDDAKLQKVQELVADVPVHSELKKVRSGSSSKDAIAGVDIRYRSRAKYDEVLTFYRQVLAERGWTLEKSGSNSVPFSEPGMHTAVFKKDDVELVINHWEAKSGSPEGTYDFNYIWRAQ